MTVLNRWSCKGELGIVRQRYFMPLSYTTDGVTNRSVDRAWLLEPGNAIRAGTAFITDQWKITHFDPPKVACACNAGGVYYNDGAKKTLADEAIPDQQLGPCGPFHQVVQRLLPHVQGGWNNTVNEFLPTAERTVIRSRIIQRRR